MPEPGDAQSGHSVLLRSAGNDELPAGGQPLEPPGLMSDGRLQSVTGQDADVARDLVVQAGQRGHHLHVVAAGQIGPAVRAAEEDVTAEQQTASASYRQTDPSE